MKTNKILSIIAAVAALVACQKQVVPSLEVSPEKADVAAEGGSVQITVKANVDWTAATNAAWVTLDKTKGTSTDAAIKVTAQANPSTDDGRSVVITITAGNITKTVTISQGATAKAISVDKKTLEFDAAAAEASVAVSSNAAWTASSSQTWATVEPANGTGSASVKIKVSENTSTKESRTAVVTLKAGSASATIAISQKAATPTITVDKTALEFEAEAAEASVAVSSNADWTVSSSESWAKVEPVNGTGNATVKVKVSENTSLKDARTATVTFTAGSASTTISISQKPGKDDPTKVKRPESDPSAIVGPFTVLDGNQYTLGNDPVYIGQGWAQNNGADKFVDGVYNTNSNYMSTWWDTDFSFPIAFTFDMGKDYIYDGFRFINASAFMNNFRHIRVYVALEYKEADTEWVLASEGTYKETYTWQQWPNPATLESLDKLTYKMPENNLESATSKHQLTHGRYVKVEFVEPASTAGNYVHGRGRIQEFYFSGWENK